MSYKVNFMDVKKCLGFLKRSDLFLTFALKVRNSNLYLHIIFRESSNNRSIKKVPVLSLNEWPCAQAFDLDESQLQALQLALTKEFAVIQGPPGTGKTYVGQKIARALLHNRKVWQGQTRSPILMVSYTNHALDQFVEGLLDIRGKKIVKNIDSYRMYLGT